MGCRTLGECVVTVIDHRGLTPKKLGGDWATAGHRAISAKNIKNGRLVQPESMHLVDEDLYGRWMPDEVDRGDIFITSEAPFGEVLFWDSDEKPVLSQRVFGLKPNSSICDSHYLYYWMRGPKFQGELRSRATGTTVIGLRQPELLKCIVELPDLEQQRRISEVLTSLDKRIALNARTNGYLGELCETISAEQTGIPAKLGDLCYQTTDKVSYADALPESYVSTEYLLTNKGGRQTASSMPTTGKVTRYQAGDTLVSNIRPYFKKIWFADQDGTCSGDVIAFRPHEERNAPYVYSLLRADAFFDWVMLGSKGTKMPRGDKKQMMDYPISPTCDENALKLLSCMVNRLCSNERQNNNLAELRDTLLPKLMSGEIDVSQVELTPPNSHLCGC